MQQPFHPGHLDHSHLGLEVPPVSAQEPVLGGTDWMDALDGPGAGPASPLGNAQAAASATGASGEPRRGLWSRMVPHGAQKAHTAHAAQAGLEAPGRTKASLGLRPLLIVSLCGIAVLAYLKFGNPLDKAQDLLGTTLPNVESSGPTDPDLITPEVDPRLGGPDAQHLAQPWQSAATEVLEQDMAPSLGPDVAPAAEPAITPTAQNLPAVSAVTSAQPPSSIPTAPDAAVLDARMQRMEQMMLELGQQLAQMRAQNAMGPQAQVQVPAATAAPGPSPASGPAVATAVPAQESARAAPQAQAQAPKPAARPVQAQRRPAPMAKAPAATKTAEALKPAAPAPRGPQLIAVDMWNGEPSVVVASGIPGDKRMRVLRPGDVVNGLALRSADPVTRTATFVAPGSQGLTLSVSQGG